MPAWKDYQEAVADNFRRLGLMTETDVRLEGARGRHDIDVVVRGTRVGIEFLWAIECKLWNRNVSKQAVATLSTVVQDIGADRGILLTNKGFQAGASMLATRNNITLLRTDELVAASEVEVHQHQCTLLRNRCDAVIFEVDRSGFRDRNGNQRLEHGWESMAFDTPRKCPQDRYRLSPARDLAGTRPAARRRCVGYGPVRKYGRPDHAGRFHA